MEKPEMLRDIEIIVKELKKEYPEFIFNYNTFNSQTKLIVGFGRSEMEIEQSIVVSLDGTDSITYMLLSLYESHYREEFKMRHKKMFDLME